MQCNRAGEIREGSDKVFLISSERECKLDRVKDKVEIHFYVVLATNLSEELVPIPFLRNFQV